MCSVQVGIQITGIHLFAKSLLTFYFLSSEWWLDDVGRLGQM